MTQWLSRTWTLTGIALIRLGVGGAREALVLLEDMGGAWGYLPLTTEAMRLAAEIWAQSRIDGQPGAPEENLDIDVILAAQARVAGGHIVTLNERHFKNIADVFDWRSYKPN